MKKIRVLVCIIFMFMVSLPSWALPIILKKSTVKQHSGSRTSSPVLVADLNDHEIELGVNRYVGAAHIFVYDADNTNVLCDTLQVSGKNQVVLDLSHLGNAQYSIEVVLDDGTAYRGNFEL